MYKLEDNIFAMHMALFFSEETEVPVFKFAQRIQKDFINVFPNDPEILPLPIDAPREIPRCTFKNDKNASITFSLSRMDFDGGFKVGTDWKGYISIVLLSFLKICDEIGIKIDRMGIVVQSKDDGTIQFELDKKVDIGDFCNSEEKSISYLKKKQNDIIDLNVITSVICNSNNKDADKIVSVDVNTDKNVSLPEKIFEKLAIVQLIIEEIEGKLRNVF